MPVTSIASLPSCKQAPLSATPLLWSRPFIVLCAVSLCFFSAYHLLTPSLPVYFVHLQQSKTMVGLLTSFFMASSMLTRPWAGFFTDRYTPTPLMLAGALLFAAGVAGLLFIKAPWPILGLRVLQGFGFSLFYTAGSALLTRLIPFARRAEGISYHSNAVKFAIALSPMVALFFAEKNLFNPLWFVVLSATLLSLIGTFWLYRQWQKEKQLQAGSPETAPLKAPVAFSFKRLVEAKALWPGVMMACNSVVFGALIPFVPLLAKANHLPTAGWFYILYALALIATRWLTAPIADRYGRSAFIVPGMVVVLFSLVALCLSSQMLWFLASGVLYGLGAGVVQPSLIAWVTDRTTEERRGAAMATFTLFTDIGVGGGSLLMGFLFDAYSWQAGLAAVGGVCALGLIAFLVWLYAEKQKASQCVTVEYEGVVL
jgi:MFS family permease